MIRFFVGLIEKYARAPSDASAKLKTKKENI